jgi:hypothetical protein
MKKKLTIVMLGLGIYVAMKFVAEILSIPESDLIMWMLCVMMASDILKNTIRVN